MEEQIMQDPDEISETPAECLSRALQWLCSVRGGNNFFGRILNGCTHVVEPRMPYNSCAAVFINNRGRYCFAYSPERYQQQNPANRILILVHEAGHIALRHLERMLRARLEANSPKKFQRLHVILNVAADMAVNDMCVRPLIDDHSNNYFGKTRDDFIWPESRNYPKELSMEGYFTLLMKDLKKHGFDPEFDPEKDLQDKIEQAIADASSGGGNSGQEGSESSDGNGQGQSQDSSQQGTNPSGNGGMKEFSGGTRPGDDLDDSYPGWFKALLNKNSYSAIMFDKDIEQMSDAEIERALDGARRDGKRIVRQALAETEKSRGTVPNGMKEIISELLGEPTIPWQEVVRGMIQSAITSKLNESTAYPNLAWTGNEHIEPYPGLQRDLSYRILIGADTSGSVSDEEFREFLREILGITEQLQGIESRLVMFDAACQKEEILTEEVVNSARASGYGRSGYGGTDFAPFLKYACQKDTENDWIPDAEREDTKLTYPLDLVILFTDGYAPIGTSEGGPIPEFLPQCPLIWALTPSGKEDSHMQPRIVRIGES